MLTISQVAFKLDVTRQAIYVALKNGKIKAEKGDYNIWYIDEEDMREYVKNKYSRKKSMYNGALLYDPKKGEISLKEAAKMLGLTYDITYYYIRTERIKAIRKGAAWVVSRTSVEAYLGKKPQVSVAAS